MNPVEYPGSGQRDGDVADTDDALLASPSSVQELDYEDIFAHLEKIVEALERTDLPLERAVQLYERGVVLSRVATRRLDAAELRITRLTSDTEPS